MSDQHHPASQIVDDDFVSIVDLSITDEDMFDSYASQDFRRIDVTQVYDEEVKEGSNVKDFSEQAYLELFNLSRLVASVLFREQQEFGITRIEIQSWIDQAVSDLNLNTVYDEKFLAELKLDNIDESDYQTNDDKLKVSTLSQIISEATNPLKRRGLPEDQLRQKLDAVSNRFTVIDVVQNGQRMKLKPGTACNGARGIQCGRSYMSHLTICNDAIKQLAKNGKVLLFSKDALIQANELQNLLVSPTTWAPGKKQGRTCLNASKGSRAFPSLNEAIDSEWFDNMYPMPKLPMLADIAEMACGQREYYGNDCQLAGSTIDVTSAYCQFPLTEQAAKVTTTLLKITSALGFLIELIGIYLVGIFGFKKAGNVYCQVSTAVDELHNNSPALPRRSVTYVDDGVLINPLYLIEANKAEYKEHVTAILGKWLNVEEVNNLGKRAHRDWVGIRFYQVDSTA